MKQYSTEGRVIQTASWIIFRLFPFISMPFYRCFFSAPKMLAGIFFHLPCQRTAPVWQHSLIWMEMCFGELFRHFWVMCILDTSIGTRMRFSWRNTAQNSHSSPGAAIADLFFQVNASGSLSFITIPVTQSLRPISSLVLLDLCVDNSLIGIQISVSRSVHPKVIF